MPDFVQAHSPRWLQHFRDSGYPEVVPLAAGVEGAVYDLGDGTLAKVWGERDEAELTVMRRCYEEIAAAGLPFATPEIVAVADVEGTAVTVERMLPGQPLRLGFSDRDASPEAARCLTEVLTALAGVTAPACLRQLPALDERVPLWAGAASFPDALARLIDRRASRYGDVLRARLPDFDRRRARLTELLAGLDGPPDTVIHGDLVPANILVDTDLQPLAVLDFGFLTTAGDPRFDAAAAAAIFDMYGPHAAEVTATLTARLAAELGYPAEVLAIYQAAYAAATANAFTADGSDGHFAWCLDQLAAADLG